jgi:hypothetical protein
VASGWSADRRRSVLLIVAVLAGLLTWCCAVESSGPDAAVSTADVGRVGTAVPVVSVAPFSVAADHHECTESSGLHGTIEARSAVVAAPAPAVSLVPAVHPVDPPGRGFVDPSALGPPGGAAPLALLCVWRT